MRWPGRALIFGGIALLGWAGSGPVGNAPDNHTVCGAPATPIHTVQGSGTVSPFVGVALTVEGVVSASFQDSRKGLRGFFIQAEADRQDDEPATSEGIFIYDRGFGVPVGAGERVRVTGTVAEFNGLTELKEITTVHKCSGGVPPSPVKLSLPAAVDGGLERYEAMLVAIQGPLTISQTYLLGRYGQMTLAAPDEWGKPGRLYQPTHQFPPDSAAARALAASNARRMLVLDDGREVDPLGDNPNPVPYLGPPPPRLIRAGDTVTGLAGILDQGRIDSARPPTPGYRLQPTVPPVFTPINPRSPVPPAVGGTLKVAGFNVLNYFTTLNRDGARCGPARLPCRGANNAGEFERQRTKIVATLKAIDADIVGLTEVENNGYGAGGALRDLVEALNAAPGPGRYAYIDPGLPFLGIDAIAVGLIYKPATVKPVGAAAVLTTGAFASTQAESQGGDGGYNRPPLAQTFQELAGGGRFTVVVNHFKSKRASGRPTEGNTPEVSHGQGAWNQRRGEAARELADWLATDPTQSRAADFLIIGDLNAYAGEDPIALLEQQGYINLVRRFIGESAYSYTFDGSAGYLDHALATTDLADKVSGIAIWHIDTDEPAVFDYNQEYNPPGYYSPDPYRASDHDPVLVGLRLTPGLEAH
ncbi:MAG: ExeM/NucH family extracellular endonuclease [Candidatus Competibacteraceae bacterium]